MQHLFGNKIGNSNPSSANGSNELNHTGDDQNDWTSQEEADIKSQIEEFMHCSKSSIEIGQENQEVLKFPIGMGPRKRKLIHYVAECMGLRHWGEGKKDSEKIVIVAIRQK